MDKINKYILCISIFCAVGVLTGCENRSDTKIPYFIDSPWASVSSGTNTPSARTGNSIIYTGSDIIIWGGGLQSGNPNNTGGIYNLENDVWSQTSVGTNCPSERGGHTALWTGSEMIIWGGETYGNLSTTFYSDGGRYNPSNDTWSEISNSGDCPPPRSGHSAVWTGEKVIVWGGYGNMSFTNSGAIYDPVSDDWSQISTGVGCPSARSGHLAEWTGDKMIIWGGCNSNQTFWNGAFYDPVSDSWEPINSQAPSPYPYDNVFPSPKVYTGDRIIIWGGIFPLALYPLDNGAIYNILDNTWNLTSTADGCPSGRILHSALWTGDKMIIWGGGSMDGTLNTGGIYDPVTDTWQETYSGFGTPEARYWHSAIWTGESMFIWGGVDKDVNLLNTGGIYTPPDP